MNDHTRGPWRLDADEKPGDWQVLDAAAVYVVADMPSDHTSKRTMADARLIASAPELLAALEALVSELADIGERENEPDSEALTVARAAIAKAVGE